MGSDRQPSLRAVLSWAVAGPLLFGLTTVGVWAGYRGKSLIQDEAQARHQEVGRRTRSELLPILDEPHRLNAANAELFAVTGALDDVTVRRHLWRQLQRAPSVGYVQVGYHNDGGFIGVERLDDGSLNAEVSDALRSGKGVSVLGDDGEPVGPPIEWLDGYDARTRPWYRAANKAMGATWSPIYPFSSDAVPRLGITAVQPLLGPQGQPLGVLGADIVLSQLSELLDVSHLGEGAQVALLERDGLVVASSVGSPFRLVNGAPLRVRAVDMEDPVLHAAAVVLGDRLASLSEETTFTASDPETLVFAAPFQDDRGLDWVLVVAVPEASVMGPLEDGLQVAAGLALFLLLATLGGVVGLARWLTRPLVEVSEAADALSRGSWSHPLPKEASTREIASLVRGFEAMRAHLQATLDDAERARAVAEDHSRTKTSFLTGVSHELRTPLNAIVGYSELLLEDTQGQAHEDVARVHRAATQLLALINDLLDLSRLESGHVELTMTSFELEELLDETTDALKPLFQAKGNEWVVDVETGIGPVFSDRGRLRQILVNLLANANKFTDGGVVTVRVSRAPAGLCIEVIDTGIGMPAESLPRIFEAFERVPGSERREGTGLGLAIVSVLVDALGATIEVASEEGVGTRFTLQLKDVGRPARR